MMLFALDYDGTYTAAPALWDGFVALAKEHGHEVVCVTMRYPQEEAITMPCEVVYTSRGAKLTHMAALGRLPGVWIDDKPHWIFTGAAR